ncbi:MAG: putative zinc metalloprotease [Parcubacteria group bacterium]|nr:putative zinc metalloprotease [Parcubacteria group bacterium]
MQFLRSLTFLLILLAFFGTLESIAPKSLFADEKTDIQAQIDVQNQKIKNLEAEIAQYQQQLNVIGGQKQTLQSAIKSIDVSRQQTSTQINVTQNKITSSNLKLNELALDIADKQSLIDLDKKTLASSLREMADASDTSLVEQLFSADSLADAWSSVDATAAVGQALRAKAASLSTAKVDLTHQHEDVSATKDGLSKLRDQLASQKKALDVAKTEKDRLLAQTKSQESNYQSIIAQKKAQQKSFESELSALQSSLKSVGQGNVTAVGQGILKWPYSETFAQSCVGKASALGNPYCITQYFGNTAFATANAQIYNGSGHNAIDIGMPVGTPLLAALSGTVLATGNTDAVPGCYSFGKWVMVKHANGLATLYAHMSSIGVTTGQAVSTGQVLGYSGMTGYATGPHVHFGVYAAAGVQITTLGQYRGATTPCASASMPVAPIDAYLNPMSYL